MALTRNNNESGPLMADLDVVGIFGKTSKERPQIVCICGSTRFRNEMADVNRQLTLAGRIVVSPAVFQYRGDVITDEQKQVLDELHLRKIDLADAIFVVDPGGYIGESTTREIEYARSAGKPVVRLSQIDDGGADPREF